MKQTKVKPVEGKLGILVVGCGAVATTLMTGVLMARRGLTKLVGSMTQMDKIRVGRGSEKKYLKTVQEIACEVADEYEESPAVVLGKVKNHIAESVKEGMTINTETLVEEVFEEQPKLAEAFRKRVEEVTLPKKIEVPAVSITPSFRKQRIRTDTGIEITFPAEYFQNNEFIEFRNHSDGTITIEIKQIGHITNKV